MSEMPLRVLHQGTIHRSEQFHRQAYNIRFAPLKNRDPIVAVLVTERARLALPHIGIKVRFKIIVRNRLHDKSGHVRPLTHRHFTADFLFNETESAQYMVNLPTQLLEHFSCVVPIYRLFEQTFPAQYDGIAAENNSLPHFVRHIFRFLESEPLDVFLRRFVCPALVFCVFVRRQCFKNESCLRQKLSPARRRTGKNER